MPSPRSVRAETNLTRAPGLWATGPFQLALPLDANGLGVAVTASGRLSLTPDLDVLAWQSPVNLGVSPVLLALPLAVHLTARREPFGWCNWRSE